ncbi:MAG: hypothetical protein AAF721_17120 [Myxococcota bacterium]
MAPRTHPGNKQGVGRSIGAVVAGYVAMVVGVTLGLALLMWIAADEFPRDPGPYRGATWVLVVELGMAFAAAVGGGYVCGWVARRAERGHALALAGLMLALGAVSATAEAGLKPLWSSVGIVIVGVAGVVLGAAIRRRHRERDTLRNR